MPRATTGASTSRRPRPWRRSGRRHRSTAPSASTLPALPIASPAPPTSSTPWRRSSRLPRRYWLATGSTDRNGIGHQLWVKGARWWTLCPRVAPETPLGLLQDHLSHGDPPVVGQRHGQAA